ncbi:MAG: flagellar motor protein MotA [Alphaproteobacteria bacterium]|nr:flagellar motor protein MotA [Alphaproteobacteria bacterium]
MTDPKRYLFRMIAFVVAFGVLVALLSPALAGAFMANPALNGVIVGVFVLGVLYVFRGVWRLGRDVNWVEHFRIGGSTPLMEDPPILVAPLVTMLAERKGRISLSATALRSVLDGIAARLDESRDIARYVIGLLIFLGLLGTFWGLMGTVGSITTVINNLTTTGTDLSAVFADLKSGLKAPLDGMGTAFSSSLFGLAGSLALGFLELQAGRAQNRFFNDLEEWLAGQTRLGGGALTAEGDQAVPAYVQALLEQTADSVENLSRTLDRGEDSRNAMHNAVATLAEHLATLTAQMRTEQNLMMKIAETQLELRPILARLADQTAKGALGANDAAIEHLRSLDRHVARLVEDMASGRGDLASEIRSEIRVLSRTIAAIAEKAPR